MIWRMRSSRARSRGCGLDVYEIEPLPPGHKLWRLPNVLMTPHVAVRDAGDIPERRFQIILENRASFCTR